MQLVRQLFTVQNEYFIGIRNKMIYSATRNVPTFFVLNFSIVMGRHCWEKIMLKLFEQ